MTHRGGGLLLLSFFLFSCAGDGARLEKAAFHLAQGGVSSAEKALKILDPKIERFEDLDFRSAIRMSELYIGAKIAQAGFDGVDVITRIVYDDDEETVRALRGIVSRELSLAEILSALEGADPVVEALLQRPEVDEVDLLTGEDCLEQSSLCFRLRSVFLNYGFRFLSESVARAVRETTFLSDVFDVEVCKDNLIEAPNGLPQALRQARIQFNWAGLDDSDADVLAQAVPEEPLPFVSRPRTNEMVRFVDRFQRAQQGSFQIDPNLNGELGDVEDDRADEEKVEDLCEYLKGQAE